MQAKRLWMQGVIVFTGRYMNNHDNTYKRKHNVKMNKQSK